MSKTSTSTPRARVQVGVPNKAPESKSRAKKEKVKQRDLKPSEVDRIISQVQVSFRDLEKFDFHPNEARDHVCVYQERQRPKVRSKPVQKSYAKAWLKKVQDIIDAEKRRGDLDRWGDVVASVKMLNECKGCGSRESVDSKTMVCVDCK